MTEPHDLAPDWVPEPVRREAAGPARLPAFGAPGDESATASTSAESAARVALTGWQVGALVAVVLVPFLIWFLWSSFDTEETLPVGEPLASSPPAVWPWPGGIAPAPPGGIAPAPPRPSTTYMPAPTVTQFLPPTITVPGTRPSNVPRASPRATAQLPPNLRPTPRPTGATPKAVPSSVKTIRFEFSGPPSRTYSLSLTNTGTGGYGTYPNQTGTVALELPAAMLLPGPLQATKILSMSARAQGPADLITCRVVAGGATIAFRQGQGSATCSVLSSDLGWK